MELMLLSQDFSVCKIASLEHVNYQAEFFFLSVTDEEISLICQSDQLPEDVIEFESGWKGFRIQGKLDFSLIGILSKITTLLAENEIGIFSISTYNTDYLLVKEPSLEKAIDVLKQAGYTFS